MNGLKLEPGWRHACVTWLYLFLPKSKPPTSARMAPSRGSSATNAPSTSGNCVISHVFLSVFATRINAPRRSLMLAGALSLKPDWAGLRPSPVITTDSPFCRTAVIFFGPASRTTADITSPLSGLSTSASSITSSASLGSSGKVRNFSGPR